MSQAPLLQNVSLGRPVRSGVQSLLSWHHSLGLHWPHEGAEGMFGAQLASISRASSKGAVRACEQHHETP